MKLSFNVGPIFVSWGEDLHTDDTSFYGVGLRITPYQWAFFGLSVDSKEQRHRDERVRLSQAIEDLLDKGLIQEGDVRPYLKGP
jgi:hypothetical protein